MLFDLIKTSGPVRRVIQQLPPDWLFSRSIVSWTSDSVLRRQLPILYQIFGLYCKLYFKLFSNSDRLSYGRYLLKIISVLQAKYLSGQFTKLAINDSVVCLDLSDPRFLQVVNELMHQADTKILGVYIGEGDTFVDIGANQGAFSIVASKLLGGSGLLISVEPQINLAKCVACSLSSLPTRHKVYQMAVGDYNGVIELLIPAAYSGTAGVHRAFSAAGQYSTYTVPLRRFDDELDWRSFPGEIFIKLDIEGSEYAFLKGASEMIATRRPYILMEVNSAAMAAAGTEPEVLRSFLKSLGYEKYSEANNPERELSIDSLAFKSQRNILLTGKGGSLALRNKSGDTIIRSAEVREAT